MINEILTEAKAEGGIPENSKFSEDLNGLNEVLNSLSILKSYNKLYPEENKMSEQAYEAVELARKTGKIRKGANEVTKSIEKGTAKLVIAATDIQPPEITMHLPLLCKEKGAVFVEVDSKEKLGAAAGLPVGTAAIAITQEGEARNLLKQLGVSSK